MHERGRRKCTPHEPCRYNTVPQSGTGVLPATLGNVPAASALTCLTSTARHPFYTRATCVSLLGLPWSKWWRCSPKLSTLSGTARRPWRASPCKSPRPRPPIHPKSETQNPKEKAVCGLRRGASIISTGCYFRGVFVGDSLDNSIHSLRAIPVASAAVHQHGEFMSCGV